MLFCQCICMKMTCILNVSNSEVSNTILSNSFFNVKLFAAMKPCAENKFN